MGLIVFTAVAGVLWGFARGARPGSRWRGTPFRLHRATGVLAGLALVLDAAVAGAGGSPGLGVALATPPALLACWRNRRQPGIGWLATGLVLNAAVTLTNDGMPVSLLAAHQAGVGVRALVTGGHRPLLAATHLAALADRLPVPALREVVSVGDVAVAAGVARLMERAGGTARRHRRRRGVGR